MLFGQTNVPLLLLNLTKWGLLDLTSGQQQQHSIVLLPDTEMHVVFCEGEHNPSRSSGDLVCCNFFFI